mmetsp:Transcript_52147/g.91650  ORF Transcript_52147/g.91650 Transcript_52147/m.91650 type:complete len:209 (-) Transcript_52147:104-730(-)
MSAVDLLGSNIPVWGAYLRLLSRMPVRTKCVTSAIIFILSQICSQLLTQSIIASPKKVRDFGIWGLLMPVAAHHWQNAMVQYGPANHFAKLPIDHLVYRIPIMFVFSVYCKFMDGAGLQEAWQYALKTNPSIQVTALKLWPAANIINFTVVPLPLRVLWQNVVLFFWAMYLAVRLRSDAAKQSQEQQMSRLGDADAKAKPRKPNAKEA